MLLTVNFLADLVKLVFMLKFFVLIILTVWLQSIWLCIRPCKDCDERKAYWDQQQACTVPRRRRQDRGSWSGIHQSKQTKGSSSNVRFLWILSAVTTVHCTCMLMYYSPYHIMYLSSGIYETCINTEYRVKILSFCLQSYIQFNYPVWLWAVTATMWINVVFYALFVTVKLSLFFIITTPTNRVGVCRRFEAICLFVCLSAA